MTARTDVMADMAVETGRLRAALAALEAREAEVAWLRAWKLWARRELDRAGELPDDPEPQPPDGVRPMHTINIDCCWCHVCAQAKAECRLRADRAEARLAELERDLALMTHSRDGFREAVIAGEGRMRSAPVMSSIDLTAEVARLREALTEIAENCGWCSPEDGACATCVIARAALASGLRPGQR